MQTACMPPSPLARLRALCLALPGAHEVEAWGEPTFRVANKLFAMHAGPDNHHGAGRHAVWCKALPANQQLMISADASRFFAPPYVGTSGWIGVWLDRGVDWRTVAELLEDAHAQVVAGLPKSKRPATGVDTAGRTPPTAARPGTKRERPRTGLKRRSGRNDR